MKRIPIILLSCLALFSFGKKQREFTIMSYNVRNASGMDRKVDYNRIADIIKNSGADYVAIQELDSVTGRYGGAYALKEIAGRAQMDYAYGAAIEYGGGKYGIGTASREKIKQSKTIPLPGTEEKRTMLICNYGDFIFCNVHLSLTEKDRLESVDIISKELAAYSKPVILAGDFNAKPESETMKKFYSAGFTAISDTSVYTFPADEPGRCIDYILLKNDGKTRVDFSDYRVLDEPAASDHRPLTIKVKLTK